MASGAAFALLWMRGLHPRLHLVALAGALLFRVACVLTPPAMSDDVFRYVYEGRVVWSMGPLFIFTHAPATALADGVPPELLDAAWLRINHPEIATIYPPLSQLVFVAAGGRLILLKIMLVAAELGAWVIVSRARGREAALLLAMQPLALFEIAREGHADSLSMIGLAFGVAAISGTRAYVGFAIAALAKLNGFIAMLALARNTRRGLIWALVLCVPIAIPYLAAGGAEHAALANYGGRWRSGDGAFVLFLEGAHGMLGGDWVRFFEVTITRHQVARALSASAFICFSAALLWRPAPHERVPERAAMLIFALLLFSPVLHPWYVLWLLPFLPFVRRPLGAAIVLFSVLAPLLHHGTWLELTEGRWRELGWIRALVHVPVWSVFGYALYACRWPKESCSESKTASWR